ncbi:MAG: oligoribonuclease [Gammaproteobacteria bacterium]|nr:oligoribonuclease [Gammaproteobacteria bacterium]
MKPSGKNLVWMDMEMTGLDIGSDHILEIATVVTDTRLNVLAEGPVIAVHQSEKILAGMDEWNTKTHTKSGLVERVLVSDYDEEAAEAETLEFLMKYVPCGKSPLCGNSIYQDRKFLLRWMPKLESYFHYRNLDVSTLKILAKRWRKDLAKDVAKKKSKHEALSDIYDSIAELCFYRDNFLKL